jgi:hypothetical protein
MADFLFGSEKVPHNNVPHQLAQADESSENWWVSLLRVFAVNAVADFSSRFGKLVLLAASDAAMQFIACSLVCLFASVCSLEESARELALGRWPRSLL